MIPVHKSDENLESDENLGSIDLPCNGVLAFSQSKIKSLLTLALTLLTLGELPNPNPNPKYGSPRYLVHGSEHIFASFTTFCCIVCLCEVYGVTSMLGP